MIRGSCAMYLVGVVIDVRVGAWSLAHVRKRKNLVRSVRCGEPWYWCLGG